jgi:glucose/arabinose dehydrogenase
MKPICVAALAALAGWTFVAADEPDGLRLPAGFHATVVADGLGAIRHLAVRDNGDVYVSTPRDQKGLGKGGGIIALRLDGSHRAVDVQHFGSIDGGTGIRFHNGALYATSPSGIYRFTFSGSALIPSKDPDTIVEGMPTTFPGFNRANRPLAFDASGHVFVSVEASGNFCADPEGKPNTPPVGLKPCPDLGIRAGIWRFSADKTGQKFPADGEQWATGIRDLSALAWAPADGNLYAIMHGRDSLNRNWPSLVSAEDDDHIADEMHRVTKGTDFGWPYTYYDGVRRMRLVSPEYGGDGKTAAPGNYSTPVLTFHSRRSAPVDLLFYGGTSFPASYRNGAFIVLHGTANKSGYNVVFVPFGKAGKAGEPTVFADGFAAFDQSTTTPPRARYRPIGAAVAPDGSLYVADSQAGRVWRIAYETR